MTTSNILEGSLKINPATETIRENLQMAKEEINALFAAVEVGDGVGLDVAYFTRNGGGDIIGIEDKDGVPATDLAVLSFVDLAAGKAAGTLSSGVVYRVNDLHSQGTGGGSLWLYDSAGGGTLTCKSGPIVCTFQNRPSATLYPYLKCIFSDVGTFEWISNGTRYLIASGGYAKIGKINSPVAQTSLEVEQKLASVLIPNDGTVSILQNGDQIRLTEVLEKTGVTDKLERGWRIGNDNAVTDTNIKTSDSTTVTNDVIAATYIFERISATSIRVTGAQAFATHPGTSAANPQADVTMADNMDTCSGGGVYFSTTGYLIKSGGSLVDTALNLRQWIVEIATYGG